jgi:anti-anti-sigma factor
LNADARVIKPQGRLDSSTGPALEAELVAIIESGVKRLVLDFSGLIYISSAGLRVILLAAKRMKASNGRLALCSLNPQITEVFKISGFDAIIDIQPSLDSAMARLNAP